MRELLIVGVDPGTTVGYAILDTRGKVLKLKSSKQLEINSLIEEIVELGSVLAIGTDKRKVPGLIDKAAAVIGAKAIAPKEDLAVSEKDELASGIKTATMHEKDALAAAMFAYKELEPLLDKIRKVLDVQGKAEFYGKVAETVVLDGINIKDALRKAEEREDQPIRTQTPQIASPEKSDGREEMRSLLLRRAERENEILRSYNSKLIARMKHLNKELQREKSISGRKVKPVKGEKEKNQSQLVSKMQAIITGKERQNAKLQEEIEKLASMTSAVTLGKSMVAAKLSSLGMEELEQKMRKLKMSEGGLLLVENADIFSEKALDYIRQNGMTIITLKKPGPNVAKLMAGAGIPVLAAEGLIEMESEMLALVDKGRLIDARKKLGGANVLGIIESYKEERKGLM